jgi:hypothetical protein
LYMIVKTLTSQYRLEIVSADFRNRELASTSRLCGLRCRVVGLTCRSLPVTGESFFQSSRRVAHSVVVI